ncbi:hypothetical protein JAAARDRAFT_71979 [Jaapia argillacea MUCL 33604]|uniref:Uncharacterized protein n=1 Tax=Jaapia argillacea MUCL 33604 TaxID=933084 RepID=A0A067PSH4_9AGAM|nr:hypothetical protein JAAARDRAFT_71979 [Jaapia argillacea MUCL 33604]
MSSQSCPPYPSGVSEDWPRTVMSFSLTMQIGICVAYAHYCVSNARFVKLFLLLSANSVIYCATNLSSIHSRSLADRPQVDLFDFFVVFYLHTLCWAHTYVVLPLSGLSPNQQRRITFATLVFIIPLFASTLSLLTDTPISMTYCGCFMGMGMFRPLVWSPLVTGWAVYFLFDAAIVLVVGALSYSWNMAPLLAEDPENDTLNDEEEVPRGIVGSSTGGGIAEDGKMPMEAKSTDLTIPNISSSRATTLTRQRRALYARKMTFILRLTVHLVSLYIWCLLLVSGAGWWKECKSQKKWVGYMSLISVARPTFWHFMEIVGMFREPSQLDVSPSPQHTRIEAVEEPEMIANRMRQESLSLRERFLRTHGGVSTEILATEG